MRVLKCFCLLIVGSHVKDRCIFKSIAFANARRIHICAQQESSGGSRGGSRGARPLILGGKKKEEMTEGRKAGWASKIEPAPLLSSKSGSATGVV